LETITYLILNDEELIPEMINSAIDHNNLEILKYLIDNGGKIDDQSLDRAVNSIMHLKDKLGFEGWC